MKIKRRHQPISIQRLLFLGTFLLLPGLTFSQEEITLSPDSKNWIRLEGDSTLHPYYSTATVIQATAILEGAPDKKYLERLLAGGLKDLRVTIPVKDLKSGKKGLDKNMWNALKSEDHPTIDFQLTDYEVEPSTHAFAADMKVKGVLEVAGVDKEILMTAKATGSDQNLRFEGKKELLMSDFGIKPPKMFLGTIKTSDEVQIYFDLQLNTK